MTELNRKTIHKPEVAQTLPAHAFTRNGDHDESLREVPRHVVFFTTVFDIYAGTRRQYRPLNIHI
jgi:hypothetical protein